MTSERFDRRLEAGLERLASPAFPDYFDDLLAVTSRTRQRPTWVFPERWLPMLDTVARPQIAPRLSWRMLALLIALVLAVGVAGIALVGARPQVPPPFGVARNGLIGFVQAGAIHVSDPLTGASRIVAPDGAWFPRFSPDGRSIAFLRLGQGGADPADLYVADVTAGTARRLTPQAIPEASSFTWSPDGRLIAVDAGKDGTGNHPARIVIVNVDGSGARPLDVGMPAGEPVWSPPDGRDILFRTWSDGVGAFFLVHPDGSGLRPLGIRTTGTSDDLGMAEWSPNGRQVAYVYGAVDPSGVEQARLHIVDADGTDDRTVTPPGTTQDYDPVWSPDGTLLALHRWRFQEGSPVERWVTIVTVDGSRPMIDAETPPEDLPDFGWNVTWAPDGRSLIAERTASPIVLSIDPTTGKATPLQIATSELPTWQRLAP